MFFKLICGLGNNNVNEVKDLVAVYAHAGAYMFDSSTKMAEVVQNTVREEGLSLEKFKFCISISIGEDIHGSRAQKSQKLCANCGACTSVCPRGSMEDCIGCMRCKDVCKHGAIYFIYEAAPWEELTDAANRLKIDYVELHANVKDEGLIISEFEKLCGIFKGGVSVCLSREYFQGEELVGLLTRLRKIAVNNEDFVIQADGKAMSGCDNELETTRPCVEFGKFLEGHGFKVILSGGVNAQTPKLADEYKLHCEGLAYGSYARMIVKNIDKVDAIKAAKELVCTL